jgi:GNAT superfamily N-acetyltransferase
VSRESLVARIAVPQDARAVAELTTQLGYEVNQDDVGVRLERVLSRDNERLFVAGAEGRVVGWVHAVVADFVDVEAFVLIAGLVVDRTRRRQGIGRALLNRAEAWAREQGCSMVRLSSSATRTKAHRFYEELGYVNLKTQYSFAKPLDADAAARLGGLVPRVDP